MFVLLSRTKFERACERVLPVFWGWVRMRGGGDGTGDGGGEIEREGIKASSGPNTLKI